MDGRTDVLAYEVLGTNAATGVAYDKWIVYVAEEKQAPSPAHWGKAALVKMQNQPVTLKVVEAGTFPGRYNLRSTLTGQVLEDAPIEWVSPVEWIKPR